MRMRWFLAEGADAERPLRNKLHQSWRSGKAELTLSKSLASRSKMLWYAAATLFKV